MHDHNNKSAGKTGVRWVMILGLLLLGGILFLGGNTLSSSEYFWPILVGVFAVAHIWMMFKGHGGHKENDVKDTSDAALEKQPGTKNERKHGGCCH